MSIIVFTDGTAKGNPWPGGWGAIVVTDDQRERLRGHAVAKETRT